MEAKCADVNNVVPPSAGCLSGSQRHFPKASEVGRVKHTIEEPPLGGEQAAASHSLNATGFLPLSKEDPIVKLG